MQTAGGDGCDNLVVLKTRTPNSFEIVRSFFILWYFFQWCINVSIPMDHLKYHGLFFFGGSETLFQRNLSEHWSDFWFIEGLNASCASQFKASLLWSPGDLHVLLDPFGTSPLDWNSETLHLAPDLMRFCGGRGISLYLTMCYSYHVLPYVIIMIFHRLLYFAISYLSYQYCSKVLTHPNWADLETIGRLFFWWVFSPVSAVLDVHPQFGAPTSAIMPCITCKPIRPNISTSSR